MCVLTTKNVRRALERTRRGHTKNENVRIVGDNKMELRWKTNGKTYKKCISMADLRSAYADAVSKSGL